LWSSLSNNAATVVFCASRNLKEGLRPLFLFWADACALRLANAVGADARRAAFGRAGGVGEGCGKLASVLGGRCIGFRWCPHQLLRRIVTLGIARRADARLAFTASPSMRGQTCNYSLE
jgi:hypothetical protein